MLSELRHILTHRFHKMFMNIWVRIMCIIAIYVAFALQFNYKILFWSFLLVKHLTSFVLLVEKEERYRFTILLLLYSFLIISLVSLISYNAYLKFSTALLLHFVLAILYTRMSSIRPLVIKIFVVTILSFFSSIQVEQAHLYQLVISYFILGILFLVIFAKYEIVHLQMFYDYLKVLTRTLLYSKELIYIKVAPTREDIIIWKEKCIKELQAELNKAQVFAFGQNKTLLAEYGNRLKMIIFNIHNIMIYYYDFISRNDKKCIEFTRSSVLKETVQGCILLSGSVFLLTSAEFNNRTENLRKDISILLTQLATSELNEQNKLYEVAIFCTSTLHNIMLIRQVKPDNLYL